jgi:hypothetical protein
MTSLGPHITGGSPRIYAGGVLFNKDQRLSAGLIKDKNPGLKPNRYGSPLSPHECGSFRPMRQFPFCWPILPLNRKILGDLRLVAILKWS